MNFDDISKIVSDYDALLAKALLIAGAAPHYMGVEHEDNARLSIESDSASIRWVEYESDYYGGGSLNERCGSFPAALLLMDEAQIENMQRVTAEHERERSEKVKRAQEIIRREREEFAERALYAQLWAKYGNHGR